MAGASSSPSGIPSQNASGEQEEDWGMGPSSTSAADPSSMGEKPASTSPPGAPPPASASLPGAPSPTSTAHPAPPAAPRAQKTLYSGKNGRTWLELHGGEVQEGN